MAMDNFRLPRKRGALWYDGSNDYVDCGSGTLLPTTSPWTLCFWAFPNGRTNFDALITLKTGGISGFVATVSYAAFPNRVPWWFGNQKNYAAIRVQANTAMIYRVAAHYAIVYNGVDPLVLSSFAAYNNAELQVINILADTIINPRTDVNRLGQETSATSQYLWGCLWDVRVYAGALTSGQIAEVMRGGAPAATLSAHWQGTGNANAHWVDLSGNGHHGTVSGSPESGCMIHKAQKKIIRTIGGVRTVVV